MASGKNLSGGKSVPQDLAGDVDRFLQQVASAPLPAVLEDPEPAGRLIFSLDATGSRQATWDLAVSIQAEMFKEADAVGGLDVQLVYYRGIMDYKFSPWERRAEALAKRMMAVRCQPGRTQIGRILSHAIRESRQNKVNAVVFVGDCCEESEKDLYRMAGQLGLLGTPLFLFHEGDDDHAAGVFGHIAKITGGAALPFNARSARELRDLLRAVAVFATGGGDALLKFAQRTGGAAKLLEYRMGGSPEGSRRAKPAGESGW